MNRFKFSARFFLLFLFLVLFSAAFVSGCATQPAISSFTPEQIKAKTHAEHDALAKNTMVRCLRLVFGERGENGYYLQAFKADADDQVIYTFRLDTMRSREAAAWEAAFDQDGHAFAKVAGDVNYSGTFVMEKVIFRVTREWLNSVSAAGIKLRVAGPHLQQLIAFPPTYVQGFLQKVDEQFGANNTRQP